MVLGCSRAPSKLSPGSLSKLLQSFGTAAISHGHAQGQTFKPLQTATIPRMTFSPQILERRPGEFIHLSFHEWAPDLQAVPPRTPIHPTTPEQVLSLKSHFLISRSCILNTYSVVHFSSNIFPTFPICISGSSTLHLGITKALHHAAQAANTVVTLLYSTTVNTKLYYSCTIMYDSTSIYLSIWEDIKFEEK